MSEDSIFDEINEEVKHDQLMKFFDKHKYVIGSIIALIVAIILAHSSFHNRKIQRMQDVTTSLVRILQYSSAKSNESLKHLVAIAPDEIRPSLEIAVNGEKIIAQEDRQAAAANLLKIFENKNVDLIWRDLAGLVYVSHGNDLFLENRIKILEGLSKEGRPFRFSALEIMGAIYMEAAEYDKAEKCFQEILGSDGAPKTLKKRVSMLLSYMKTNLISVVK